MDQKHCYDFPEIVMHIVTCPRYRGGVCHPLPTPAEPYTEEEKAVVERYQEFLEYQKTGKLEGRISQMRLIRPTGTTGSIRHN